MQNYFQCKHVSYCIWPLNQSYDRSSRLHCTLNVNDLSRCSEWMGCFLSWLVLNYFLRHCMHTILSQKIEIKRGRKHGERFKLNLYDSNVNNSRQVEVFMYTCIDTWSRFLSVEYFCTRYITSGCWLREKIYPCGSSLKSAKAIHRTTGKQKIRFLAIDSESIRSRRCVTANIFQCFDDETVAAMMMLVCEVDPSIFSLKFVVFQMGS